MTTHISTPFGGRTLSLAQAAAQIGVQEMRAGVTVNKWAVLEDITAARNILGLPDRAVAVLRALLSFHPEVAMTSGDNRLIVFPSNESLASRAHGIAPATLKRQLGALLEAGILIRKDSPNGKRYIRKGGDGSIERAFGFDLSPLIARAAEFAAAHKAADEERRVYAMRKEELSLYKRDVTKTLAYIESQIPGLDVSAWRSIAETIAEDASRARTASVLTELVGKLVEISQQIAKCLAEHVNSTIMSRNAAQNDPHIQIQISDSSESEPAFQGSRVDSSSKAITQPPSPDLEGPEPNQMPPPREAFAPNLGLVLRACPTILDHSRGGQIRDYAELRQIALLVRSYLGISPAAWQEAVDAMGEPDAVITIVMIHEKGEAIRSAGGYLRQLTQKRKDGAYAIGPMLMALLNSQLKSGQRAA